MKSGYPGELPVDFCYPPRWEVFPTNPTCWSLTPPATARCWADLFEIHLYDICEVWLCQFNSPRWKLWFLEKRRKRPSRPFQSWNQMTISSSWRPQGANRTSLHTTEEIRWKEGTNSTRTEPALVKMEINEVKRTTRTIFHSCKIWSHQKSWMLTKQPKLASPNFLALSTSAPTFDP